MAKRRPSGDGMVRKREDGRWEGRIVVGHKENGEPIFRYVLAKTQKELLAKLHRDMDIYQDAQLTEDSRMTLGEWLDRWMEEYGAVTLRPNTLRSYTHVTPDMQRAASDVVGGFLKNLLGEELNPWQGNGKAEPAP